MLDSGLIPEQFAQFGGGDIFSLTGSVALGLRPSDRGRAQPRLRGRVLRGARSPASGSAGRSRSCWPGRCRAAGSMRRSRSPAPCSSRVTTAGFLGGAFLGSALTGRLDELGVPNVPLLWLNAWLLFGAFGAIALAASVSFDRLSPALGISLAVVLVSYFLEVLGSLWPDAKGLQPYSLFHYLDPKAVLDRRGGSDGLRGPGRRAGDRRRRRAGHLPAPGPRRPELTVSRSPRCGRRSDRTATGRSPRRRRRRRAAPGPPATSRRSVRPWATTRSSRRSRAASRRRPSRR